FSPFIAGPDSAEFGHILGFEILRRGVSGVAMEMTVKTSSGNWLVQKELTIRRLFRNPLRPMDHLPSARMIFCPVKDRLGLLSELKIMGLGSGHGVGMQQTGSAGWARRGKSYRDILAHYYQDAVISRV